MVSPLRAAAPVLAVILQWRVGLPPPAHVVLTIGTIVGSYLLVYTLALLWNLIVRAPVALDTERVAEIGELSRSHGAAQERIAALRLESADLKKPRRTDAEQIRFEEARAELKKFDPGEYDFLRFLLPRQDVNPGDLKAQMMNCGVTEAQWSTVYQKARAGTLVQLVVPSPVRPRSALVINPVYRDALTELLHSRE